MPKASLDKTARLSMKVMSRRDLFCPDRRVRKGFIYIGGFYVFKPCWESLECKRLAC